MKGDTDARSCHYPNCGFNPDFSSACARVRQAFGNCSGPCDGPCYVVADLHLARLLSQPAAGSPPLRMRD